MRAQPAEQPAVPTGATTELADSSQQPTSIADERQIADEIQGAEQEPHPESQPQLSAGDEKDRIIPQRNKENDAAQSVKTEQELDYAQHRHGHGSALPN